LTVASLTLGLLGFPWLRWLQRWHRWEISLAVLSTSGLSANHHLNSLPKIRTPMATSGAMAAMFFQLWGHATLALCALTSICVRLAKLPQFTLQNIPF